MPVRSEPREGDVVVESRSTPKVTFTIRQLPGTAQIYTPTEAKAIEVARRFAAVHGLDVWSCEKGVYRLLEAFREDPEAGRAAGATTTRSRRSARRVR
jgi:hypothetical protein